MGAPLKLLFVSNLLPPRMLGGYELSCYNIAKGFRERGYDVEVLTSPMDLPEPEENLGWVKRVLGLRRLFLPSARNPAVRDFIQFESAVSQWENSKLVLDELRSFEPDFVLAFNLLDIGGVALLDLFDTVDVPMMMNLGDNVPGRLLEDVPSDVREVFNADPATFFAERNIVAVSERLLDEIRSAGITLGDDVSVVPRGVRPRAGDRDRVYAPDGVVRFAFTGSLYPNKGLEFVLEAASVLLRDDLRFHVDVFGDGQLEHYTRLAADAGLSDAVTFHGFTSQAVLRDAYLDCDAFLFPTWDREPFGSTPIEAAAEGCVPVMSELAGASEWFIDGVSSVKISPNSRSVESAMRRIVEGRVDLAAMGAAARNVSLGPLSFDHCLDLLERNIHEHLREGWRSTRLFDPSVEREIKAKDYRASEAVHVLGA